MTLLYFELYSADGWESMLTSFICLGFNISNSDNDLTSLSFSKINGVPFPIIVILSSDASTPGRNDSILNKEFCSFNIDLLTFRVNIPLLIVNGFCFALTITSPNVTFDCFKMILGRFISFVSFIERFIFFV